MYVYIRLLFLSEFYGRCTHFTSRLWVYKFVRVFIFLCRASLHEKGAAEVLRWAMDIHNNRVTTDVFENVIRSVLYEPSGNGVEDRPFRNAVVRGKSFRENRAVVNCQPSWYDRYLVVCRPMTAARYFPNNFWDQFPC